MEVKRLRCSSGRSLLQSKGQSLALLGKAATRWHQSFPAAILSQAIWPTSISV